MSENVEWKKLKLYEEKEDSECPLCNMEEKKSVPKCARENEQEREDGGGRSSLYLIARDEQQEERRKELLYRILGPVFFGRKEAENWEELVSFFRRCYGIDVEHDFYEGDEHYEEYQEAQQAIAEGMSIYSGSIAFEESILAEYAERLWDDMEHLDKERFRRINTMLEE